MTKDLTQLSGGDGNNPGALKQGIETNFSRRQILRATILGALGASFGTVALTEHTALTRSPSMVGNVPLQLSAPVSVPSIADLRTLRPRKKGETCVIVLGFWSPDDGGGGLFYWDPKSTETDNEGTVIIPNDYQNPGRWKRVYDGALSVKWFGAKGDGQMDDTAAIERAILSLSTAGTVFFPPGIYMVSGLNLERRDGLKLVGPGTSLPQQYSGTTIRALAPQPYVLRVASLGLSIEDLALDGNLCTTDAVLVFEYLSSRITVRNVTIMRTKDDLSDPSEARNLVRLGGDTNLEVDKIVFDNVVIDQNHREILNGKDIIYRARSAVHLTNTNTFLNDFRGCTIWDAFNLVEFAGGAGANFYGCDFAGAGHGIFRIGGITQPIEISGCYTEISNEIPFLYQHSLAYDGNTPIVLRYNYVNGDNPVRITPTQPFLLEGNLFKTNVTINCPDDSNFGRQYMVALGNVFAAKGSRLFTIGVDFTAELDGGGQPSQMLKDEFRKNGKPLIDPVQVVAEIPGNRWMINDAGTSYVVTLEYPNTKKLEVYGPGSFVPKNSAQDLKCLIQLGTTTLRSPIMGLTNTLDSLALGVGGQAIVGHFSGTAPWDPPALEMGATETTTVPVLQARVGDTVTVGFDSITEAGWQISGQVIKDDTVAVTLTNQTGMTRDLPAGTVRADAWRHRI